MKTFFTAALFLVAFISTSAQVGFSSWVNGYLYIGSYSGATSAEAVNVMFSGNGNISVPNWRLSVKLKGPVSTVGNLFTLPAEKLVLRPVSVVGQGSSATPGITSIGIPPVSSLIQGTEVFLVPQSNTPLFNQPSVPQGYYNLQLKFSLSVLGGAYLANYLPWITFYAPLEFTAYDQYGNVIGRTQEVFSLQMGLLLGAPPVADQMTIQMSPDAVNSALEFKSIQDYRNGTRVTHSNGLIISSNTNYQIKVRALQPQFLSPAGSVLPLNAVNLSLASTTAVMGTSYPVTLSAGSQMIAKGASSAGKKVYYDVTYATSANDQRFISAKMENYTTTLQFEILAQ